MWCVDIVSQLYILRVVWRITFKMGYLMTDLKRWYKQVKENSRCIVCTAENKQPPDNIELHHLNHYTKKSCVNRFIVKRDYKLAYLEMLKCVPVCSPHHREIHKQSNKSELYNKGRFDFTQGKYPELIDAFRINAMLSAPRECFVKIPPNVINQSINSGYKHVGF